jgi:hypothetical protein
MSKVESLAQMQEVLDRKNEALSQRSVTVYSHDVDFGRTFDDRDLTKPRRDQVNPDHLWGRRPTQHFKRSDKR